MQKNKKNDYLKHFFPKKCIFYSIEILTVIIERNRENAQRLYTVMGQNSCDLKPRTPSNRSQKNGGEKCAEILAIVFTFTKKNAQKFAT